MNRLPFFAALILVLAPAASAQQMEPEAAPPDVLVETEGTLPERGGSVLDAETGAVVERMSSAKRLARVEYTVAGRLRSDAVTPAFVRDLASTEGLEGLTVAESGGGSTTVEVLFVFQTVDAWAEWSERSNAVLSRLESASVSSPETRLEVRVY